MVELKWIKVHIKQLNYRYIPVNQLNPAKQLNESNELLKELKDNYVRGEFVHTNCGGLSRHVKNIIEHKKFEITQHSRASIEIIIYNIEKGWTRVKFCNDFRTNDDKAISGTKSLKKLIEYCPEIADYVCEDEEENHKWREEAKKFYTPEGFMGVREEFYNNRELKHVYSLDFHWAFPSALATIIPSTRDKLEELYDKRKTDKSGMIKAIGVAAIGTMCSVWTKNIGLKAEESLAKLRYEILNLHNQRMQFMIKEIKKQGGIILNLRTDSIKFASPRPLILPHEGDGLGKWSYEFRDCRYRQRSTAAYEYIDNEGKYHAVLSGSCKRDKTESREEWKWGDIYRPDASIIELQFNWRDLRWDPVEPKEEQQ